MDLQSSFVVDAPIARVWDALMDVERVAGCLPGAQVLGKVSDDAYQLGVKVKLGPVTMQYRGNLDVVERDERGHRAVLSGQAKETRGQGTAKATATMRLEESDGATRGVIDTQLSLSGKAAAMGKSVIGGVSDQLMRQFARNLQAMLDEPTAERTLEAAVAGPDRGTESGTEPGTEAGTEPGTGPRSEAETGPAAEPATAEDASPQSVADAPAVQSRPTPDAADEQSLDALQLARGMVAGQLANPRAVTLLIGAAAVVAFLLGRRSGRRAA